jgi:hypothetical protein
VHHVRIRSSYTINPNIIIMRQKYKHIDTGTIVLAEQQTEDHIEPKEIGGKPNPRWGAQKLNHGRLSVPQGGWKLWNAHGGIIDDRAPSDASFKAEYELVAEDAAKPEPKKARE